MTELMTKALEALRELPDEWQDELAPLLLARTDDEPFTEADAAAIAEAKAQLARGSEYLPRPCAHSGRSTGYDRLCAAGAG